MVGQTDTTFITGDSIFYPVQNGRYRVKIRNAVATKLTLKSQPIDYVAPPVLNNTFIASSESALQQHDKATVFLVYPNPAKDMLHIQTQGKVTIQLSDQSGKILITKTINGNGEINVSQLAAGLYYLKNKNTGETQKIIVTK